MLKYLGFGLTVAGGLALMLLRPAAALSASAQLLLGGVVIVLGLWIFRPFSLPLSVGGFALAGFALAIGLPAEMVFSGMTQSAVWTLAGALFFGCALQKTGLGRRIALGVLRIFRPSYGALAAAWTLIGLALSALTPSITVRVAIVAPIAASCCELCGLAPRSRGSALIQLTAFVMAMLPGGGWLSGTLTGAVLQGAYEMTPGLAGVLDFSSWLRAALLPTELAAVFTLALALLFLRPKEPLDPGVAAALRAAAPGPLTRRELCAAAVLTAAFVMFATGGLHGIPSAAVCLGAAVLLFALGVLEPADVGSGVSWDLVLFIGFSLSLGPMLTAAGVTAWLTGLLVPLLRPVAGNPWLFVAAVTAVLFLWHLVDVASFMPTLSLVPAMLPAVREAFGIDPLVFVPILSLATISFVLAYQNIWALMAQSAAGRQVWTAKQLAVYGLCYFAAALAALLACVPLWQHWGWFG